ncbi:hypothetical protein BLM37_00075 [Candidatus Gracilibacteria bacterium GN02-873]|nr:hypothetical protein BLM37_00075 [Candidatus Gracilibacteria bacterium GN02-873]
MNEQNLSHHENLASKIEGKEASFFDAFREYLASLAGFQTLSKRLMRALQETHQATENILSDNSQKKN